MLLTKKIQLHKAQYDFRHSQALYRGFVGGRGVGKSFVGAYDTIRRAKKGCLYLVVSPTYPMLADATFRTFIEIGRELGVIPFGSVRKSPPAISLSTGAEVIFRSADDPDRLRGPNLSGCWLDEASLMNADVYSIVIASLREGGERGWLSATFTPKGFAHWTFERFGKANADTELFKATTFQNPFLHPEFAATIKRQYTEGEARQELGGEFIDADEHLQVIPTAWVSQAMARWKPDGRGEQKLSAVGVDVARGGPAKTVLAKRYGHWFAPLEKYPGSATPDGPAVVGLIALALKDNTKALVVVDVIGIGSSVFDGCAARNWNVLGANFAAGTKNTDSHGLMSFVNLRAWAYWSFRELLDPANKRDVQLPPDQELLADLTATKWLPVAGGVKLESKDDVAERLGRSPDSADAIIYSTLLRC